MNKDNKTMNCFDLMPKDWTYMVKKAMNYRVFSDPMSSSVLVDIVSEEMDNVFHDKVISFQFDDINRLINVRIISNNSNDINIINQIFCNSIMKFCMQYRFIIENAVREVAGIQYERLITDIIENNQIMTLSQIVNIQTLPIPNGYSATLRFF